MWTVTVLGVFLVIYFVFFKDSKSKKVNHERTGTERITKAAIQTEPSSRLDTINEIKNHEYDSFGITDDDDLATFKISHGYKEEKSKNKTIGRWIKPGEEIKVKDFIITAGNFFYGGVLRSYSVEHSYLGNQDTEASLVDDSLNIRSEVLSYEDESLGYWPKFISLSPRGRGAYLNWLSGERSDPETPIGYVFIYFYGLERRILVDSLSGDVDDQEFSSLFDEVKRLKEAYGQNYSVLRYSTRLLEMMCLVRPTVVMISDIDFTPANDSLLFKHRLATAVDAGEPISAELALLWIKYYPEYNLRTPARRCNVYFSQLFKSRYTQKFEEGIVVKPNKTRLKLDYFPASSTIRGVNIEQQNLPDPSVLKAPVKKLMSIAESCTEELDAYSRYLGKKDTSPSDVAAILLLPDELVTADNSTVIGNFKKWADDCIAENNGLVSLADYWKHTGTPLPSKLNKKETELIQNLARKAGFGIAPDSRFHHAKPSMDGNIVVFANGHGEFFEPSKAFNEVGMALRLGAMIANVDSHLDDSEVSVLHQLIDHDIKLSPVEKHSLHAYLTWRLNTPANMQGLKTKLEKLGSKEKNAVSHILITVALADGKIDPSEIKQLEKLYTALGLDKSMVTSDVHGISSSKAVAKTTMSAINHPSAQPSQRKKTGFQLDDDILALHESETKEVQSMLGAIFVDDEVQGNKPEHDVVESPAHVENTLDTPHYDLFRILITKEKWARKEVEELCESLALMVDGAMETINDWSFESVDAPLLEDDDDIYVDQEIVEELEGLKC